MKEEELSEEEIAKTIENTKYLEMKRMLLTNDINRYNSLKSHKEKKDEDIAL